MIESGEALLGFSPLFLARLVAAFVIEAEVVGINENDVWLNSPLQQDDWSQEEGCEKSEPFHGRLKRCGWVFTSA